MKLENKNIFITGSNRGMGKAFAEELAKRGVNLFHLVRSVDSVDVDHYKRLGAKHVEVIKLDLTDSKNIDEVIQNINAQWDVDVLINNAGLLTGGLIESQPTQDIYNAIQVNLTGLIHLTKGLLPKMIKRGSGKIVNNASVSGKMFFPCASTYAATKAGVVAFTESIKQEIKPAGLTTLLLITSGVKTEMYDEINTLYGENLELDFMSAVPMQEWASKMVKAIKTDKEVLMPGGASNFGVFLGHHFPKLFQFLIKGKFKR